MTVEDHWKNAVEPYYGKLIKWVLLDPDRDLRIGFADGVTISLRDAGQSCCEHRYITCDDDVAELVGQKLLAVGIKFLPDIDGSDSYGELHEQAAIELQGDQTSIVMTTHNEHNGYYGGFDLVIEELKG